MKCKACGAELRFILTPERRQMPCEERETTIVDVDGKVHKGWVVHWANCPQTVRFRKKEA